MDTILSNSKSQSEGRGYATRLPIKSGLDGLASSARKFFESPPPPSTPDSCVKCDSSNSGGEDTPRPVIPSSVITTLTGPLFSAACSVLPNRL